MKEGANFYILKASGRFDPYLKDLEQTINLAIKKTTEKIPVDKVDLVIYDNPAQVIKEVGVGGRTHLPYLVRISLNPGFPNFGNVIKYDLPRSISHELHHAARWKTVGYSKTLGEAIITEGLAVSFETEVWGGKPSQWATAVKGAELNKLLKIAKEEANDDHYNHYKWFFGKADLPRWAGYSLGYYLVQKYLAKHPQELSSTLLSRPVGDFW